MVHHLSKRNLSQATKTQKKRGILVISKATPIECEDNVPTILIPTITKLCLVAALFRTVPRTPAIKRCSWNRCNVCTCCDWCFQGFPGGLEPFLHEPLEAVVRNKKSMSHSPQCPHGLYEVAEIVVNFSLHSSCKSKNVSLHWTLVTLSGARKYPIIAK